jgi:hypothetical protein
MTRYVASVLCRVMTQCSSASSFGEARSTSGCGQMCTKRGQECMAPAPCGIYSGPVGPSNNCHTPKTDGTGRQLACMASCSCTSANHWQACLRSCAVATYHIPAPHMGCRAGSARALQYQLVLQQCSQVLEGAISPYTMGPCAITTPYTYVPRGALQTHTPWQRSLSMHYLPSAPPCAPGQARANAPVNTTTGVVHIPPVSTSYRRCLSYGGAMCPLSARRAANKLGSTAQHAANARLAASKPNDYILGHAAGALSTIECQR